MLDPAYTYLEEARVRSNPGPSLLRGRWPQACPALTSVLTVIRKTLPWIEGAASVSKTWRPSAHPVSCGSAHSGQTA